MIAFASQQFAEGGRVLAIDDEPAILSVLTRALTRFGWEVECASDGVEALEMLARGESDPRRDYRAVICDLNMPGISGQGLHAWLLVERPEVIPRLIFTSGNVHAPAAADFLLGAGCAVLPKPFDLAALHEQLTQVAGTQVG